MSNPVQLKINTNRPANIPKENAQADLNEEQTQALINAIFSLNPSVFSLPENKTKEDVHVFRILVRDGVGQLSIIFN